eukprot:COSAG02_NODE_9734_length_2127_cov_1.394477_2_plen_99_part_01
MPHARQRFGRAVRWSVQYVPRVYVQRGFCTPTGRAVYRGVSAVSPAISAARARARARPAGPSHVATRHRGRARAHACARVRSRAHANQRNQVFVGAVPR